MKTTITAALAMFALSGPITAAAAVTVYSYTSQKFNHIDNHAAIPGEYTEAMRITGTVTLSAPLAPNLPDPNLFDPASFVAPTAFSFNDGRVTITQLTSSPVAQPVVGTETFFYFSTDASGRITGWWVQLWLANPAPYSSARMYAFNNSVLDDDYASITLGRFSDTAFTVDTGPGAWTVAQVPEPEIYAMLLAGLALTIPTIRRKRARSGVRIGL